LNRNHARLLITFEGIDRCGKSTQAGLLEEKFQEERIEYELFREPGSTVVSEQIRRILLSVDSGDMDYRCELMLYAAARAQLVSEKILPALEGGKVVIIDRFYDSTTAYQGYGRNLPIELIESVNTLVTQNTVPDLTFILDISPEDALMRRDEAGRDRLERSSMEFFERVRDGYLELSEKEDRISVIDGNLSIEEIAQKVWEKVSGKL